MPWVRTDVVIERVDPMVRDGTRVDERMEPSSDLLGGGVVGGTPSSHLETGVLHFFDGPGLSSPRELRTKEKKKSVVLSSVSMSDN